MLQTLADRGIRAGVLSNGDPDMLDVTLRSAGLIELIDPDPQRARHAALQDRPAAYALGPAALGLPAAEILFVSSNCWDAIGAAWYGYTTLWINRADAPMEQLGIAPTRVGHVRCATSSNSSERAPTAGLTRPRPRAPHDGRRTRFAFHLPAFPFQPSGVPP